MESPRRRASGHQGQFVFRSLSNSFQTAEVTQQLCRGLLPNSRNSSQLASQSPGVAARAVEGHRKAMSFVAHQLHQVQHRRKLIEHDGFVFLPVNVNPLFALGDRRQRLVGDPERFERLRGRVQLSDAAVD